jgi:Tfp pilus assembly protein PilN
MREERKLAPELDHGTGSKSVPRWHMSPLVWMLTVWGVLTGALVILLIYRGTLTMQEDDQLFLDDTKSQMQQDQAELIAKVNKINPFVKILGAVSGIMFLIIAGMFIYQGLNSTAF